MSKKKEKIIEEKDEENSKFIGNFPASAEFCPMCGNLIDLYTATSNIECTRCKFTQPLTSI